ncbi:Hint domain-containing protein [Roseicyclus marinus]|uniref:Hint domain-containing protein n=1 Tax=Roseicyclus marinus TaxID=2161673 RepID=UPI00240EE8CB|nr:Hint domain-containing protein [Roseicyclus marinus]MDG3042431.1 Hint domain-containing protein [Roseicyclus marinus]
MPTTYRFNVQVGASGETSAGALSSLTITAVVDDVTISPGDQVTISGLNSNVSSVSGIPNGGTATYVGMTTFAGLPCYIFTVDGLLTNPDTLLGLANDVSYSTAERELKAFANDTDSRTLSDAPACFLSGTAIGVPGGVRAVESLRPGDPVLTADGRVVAVRFNLRQIVSTLFGPAERVSPIRVRAGALGQGVPDRDLVVTADHALMVAGVLVNAGALVNGAGIDRVPVAELGATYVVHHIETEGHDIILAEGVPAETYIDYAGRRVFDNYAEYVALLGEEREIIENPAPRVTSARMLPPAIRARLGIVRAA